MEIKVINIEIKIVIQNPNLLRQNGNIKNIGIVGNKYSKVYETWFEILLTDTSSKYNQNKIKKVVIGIAANKPPSLSWIFAISVIATIRHAVTKTFTKINIIA